MSKTYIELPTRGHTSITDNYVELTSNISKRLFLIKSNSKLKPNHSKCQLKSIQKDLSLLEF